MSFLWSSNWDRSRLVYEEVDFSSNELTSASMGVAGASELQLVPGSFGKLENTLGEGSLSEEP